MMADEALGIEHRVQLPNNRSGAESPEVPTDRSSDRSKNLTADQLKSDERITDSKHRNNHQQEYDHFIIVMIAYRCDI